MRNHVPNMLLGSLCLALSALAHAQIAVSPINGTTVTKDTLAASLLGANSGITITDVTYAGANIATGEFSGGTNIVGIASGIVLTSGSVNNVVGPNSSDGETTANGLPGDVQLSALAGAQTSDASVLTITFVPTGTTLHAVPRASVNGMAMEQMYYDYASTTFSELMKEIDGSLPAKK